MSTHPLHYYYLEIHGQESLAGKSPWHHKESDITQHIYIHSLEKGEIIERGNHDQLLALKGRYYELYTGKKELD